MNCTHCHEHVDVLLDGKYCPNCGYRLYATKSGAYISILISIVVIGILLIITCCPWSG